MKKAIILVLVLLGGKLFGQEFNLNDPQEHKNLSAIFYNLERMRVDGVAVIFEHDINRNIRQNGRIAFVRHEENLSIFATITYRSATQTMFLFFFNVDISDKYGIIEDALYVALLHKMISDGYTNIRRKTDYE